MNDQLSKLFSIAQKKERRILGLMSGTSLDGLDIALCKITGAGKHTKLELLKFETLDYDDVFRRQIREVFAKREINLPLLCGLNPHVGTVHAKLINTALDNWGMKAEDVDLIASHGQTIYHAPQSYTGDQSLPDGTLQIGDGDHIAVHTGIITLSDFRQKHIAKGGEGAPLAAYGDYLLFSSVGENRILLNIGGISNFTFLPKIGSKMAAYATDIGPGNTIMNQYMYRHFDQEMDKDAVVAMRGELHVELLNGLLDHDFFQKDSPKTTGPELFNLDLLSSKISQLNLENISHEDVMATLCHYSAQVIIDAVNKQLDLLDGVTGIYVSGGGLHNPLLQMLLQRGLSDRSSVQSFEELGVNPDAKEACLFAVLANESIVGNSSNVDNIKASPAVCMGKISFPD